MRTYAPRKSFTSAVIATALICALLALPAWAAVSIRKRGIALTPCFNATISAKFLHTPATFTTTYGAADAFGPVTWSTSLRAYSPLSAEGAGNLVEDATNVAAWKWDKETGRSATLRVSYAVNFEHGVSDVLDSSHWYIGRGPCPFAVTAVPVIGGDAFHSNVTAYGGVAGTFILEIDDGECFGLIVDNTDPTTNPTVDVKSINISVQQISTEELHCGFRE